MVRQVECVAELGLFAKREKVLARIPLGRLATSDDLLGAVIYLSSEASDFVTGQTLFVDGGWVAAS